MQQDNHNNYTTNCFPMKENIYTYGAWHIMSTCYDSKEGTIKIPRATSIRKKWADWKNMSIIRLWMRRSSMKYLLFFFKEPMNRNHYFLFSVLHSRQEVQVSHSQFQQYRHRISGQFPLFLGKMLRCLFTFLQERNWRYVIGAITIIKKSTVLIAMSG